MTRTPGWRILNGKSTISCPYYGSNPSWAIPKWGAGTRYCRWIFFGFRQVHTASYKHSNQWWAAISPCSTFTNVSEILPMGLWSFRLPTPFSPPAPSFSTLPPFAYFQSEVWSFLHFSWPPVLGAFDVFRPPTFSWRYYLQLRVFFWAQAQRYIFHVFLTVVSFSHRVQPAVLLCFRQSLPAEDFSCWCHLISSVTT